MRIKDYLSRFLGVTVTFAVGFLVASCGLLNPDNPEPPVPEPGEESVIHDYSKSADSKVEVVSIDVNEEGNRVLTINVPKDQIPKVDEYLVSGPTELAPYGYLLRVTKVTKESETRGIGDTIEQLKVKVEAVIAGINEVIRNISFNKIFTVPLPDVSFEDFKPVLEGLNFTMTTWTEDDPVILDHGMNADGDLEYVTGLVSADDGEPKKKGNKASISFDAFEIDGIKIKPSFDFIQKGLYLFLDVQEGTFQKMGFDYEANLSCSLEIQDTFKGKLVDKKLLLGSLVQSYVFPAGEVPVVVTLVLPLTLEIKLDGSVSFSFKPLDVDLDIGIGTYYDFPRNSFMPYGSHKEIVDIHDNTSQKEYSYLGNIDSDLTMKGNFSLDFSTGVSVGLYGCNVIDRKAGWMIDSKNRSKAEKELLKAFKDLVAAEVIVDTKAALSAKMEIGSIDEVAADLYIKDECGFKWDLGCTIAGSFKIPFFGNLAPSWDSPRHVFYDSAEDIRFPHTLFFSGFSDLTVEEVPSNASELVVSVFKSRPLFGSVFGYQPYKERSFGLYFVPSELKNDALGTSSPNWKQCDLSGNPDYAMEGSSWWTEIIETIPKSEFETDRYYDVYAYTEIDGPVLGDMFLFRTNKQFRITESGRLSMIDLEDVPGENL